MHGNREFKLYVILTSLLCVVFVSSNLICKKFISINFLQITNFEISVGVLFFPVTFLITDMLTEFYGRKLANQAVVYCLATGLMIMLLIYIANSLSATQWSPVDDRTFAMVFDVYNISVGVSFITFYISQMFDIYIFSSIKKITGNRHLWLRNNISSFISQLIDTILIVGILTAVGVIPYESFISVLLSSYCFKLIVAVLDTPICYLAHSYLHLYLSNKEFTVAKEM